MATIQFNSAFNLDAVTFYPSATLVSQTSGSLSYVTPSGVVDTFYGSFSTNSIGILGGTITGFTETLPNSTALFYEASGVNFLLSAYNVYYDRGDIQGLLAAVLGRNDTIRGSEGDDYFNGYVGADSISGNGGADRLYGGKDDDVINGNAGNDTVNGNVGADTVRGGQGEDSINGGQDNDQLFGDLGNDTLSGDRGNDLLSGGEGADLFILAPGGGADTISDFEHGTDHLQLAAGLGSYTTASVSGGIVLSFTTGETLTVLGVPALDASDFV